MAHTWFAGCGWRLLALCTAAIVGGCETLPEAAPSVVRPECSAVDSRRLRMGAPSDCPPGPRRDSPSPVRPDPSLTTDAGAPADAGAPVDAGGPSGPELDWNFTTPVGVTAAPALFIVHYPTPDPTDSVYLGLAPFFGGPSTFYKLTNLYQVNPTVAWSKSFAGLDRSAVALSSSGSQIFALAQDGQLWCWNPAGNNCAGWAVPSYSAGAVNGVSTSSPWYEESIGAVFFGDLDGFLHKVNALDGTLVWRVQIGSTHSSPLYFGGKIFIGTDAGTFLRVTDPGNRAPAGAQIETQPLCVSPGCNSGGEFSVYNGASVDSILGKVYVAAAGRLYELNVAGAWGVQATVTLPVFAPNIPMYSSPLLDWQKGRLYVGYRNALFGAAYPFTGSGQTTFTPLYGAGPSWFPTSSPLVWNDRLYIGNGAGRAEIYGCLPSGAPQRVSLSPLYGVTVDTMPLIDYANGNVLFGYTNANGSGGLVQITQSAVWGCATEVSCATACSGAGACKANATSASCVPDGIPPSLYWASEGGGSGSAGGMLDQSVGGTSISGTATAAGGTITFGAFTNEVY